MFNDLREFIARVNQVGELQQVDGADWDLEIGRISEIETESASPRLLLFDNIKGHEPGYRVASILFGTPRRIALLFGLPEDLTGINLVRAMKERLEQGITPIPPVEVKTGPVMENVFTGDDVDIMKFPTPKWHMLDGGRYIGTNSVTITRDPDGGWVNVAPNRVQVHDRNTATINLRPGCDTRIIREKYWAQGKGCPVVVSCGQEPLLFAAADWPARWGESELDFAGGLKGAPIEVVKGITTDLPVPATAEIVLEGEVLPPEAGTVMEGPFGEWAGYYAGGSRPHAIFRVNALMHRNQPIIQGGLAGQNPIGWTPGRHIWRAALAWSELERQIPGVQGVWVIAEASVSSTIVASIKQHYGGHAVQTAQLLNSLHASMINCRYCIVVDEDIDPSNLSDVLWAVGTRTDPAESIQIVRHTYATPGNPTITPEQRARGDITTSTAHIIACKPYYWKDKFPPAVRTPRELLWATHEKWSHLWE